MSKSSYRLSKIILRSANHGKEYCFAIVGGGKDSRQKIVFRANDLRDLEEWMSSFKMIGIECLNVSGKSGILS